MRFILLPCLYQAHSRVWTLGWWVTTSLEKEAFYFGGPSLVLFVSEIAPGTDRGCPRCFVADLSRLRCTQSQVYFVFVLICFWLSGRRQCFLEKNSFSQLSRCQTQHCWQSEEAQGLWWWSGGILLSQGVVWPPIYSYIALRSRKTAQEVDIKVLCWHSLAARACTPIEQL